MTIRRTGLQKCQNRFTFLKSCGIKNMSPQLCKFYWSARVNKPVLTSNCSAVAQFDTLVLVALRWRCEDLRKILFGALIWKI